MAIDKINGNSYGYQNGNTPHKNTTVKNYEQTAAKPASNRSADKPPQTSHARKSASVQDSNPGVILDLSSGRSANTDKSKEQTGGFFAGLKRAFASVIQWLKDFWNSDFASSQQKDQSSQQAAQDGQAQEQSSSLGAGLSADTSAADPQAGADARQLSQTGQDEADGMSQSDHAAEPKARTMADTLMEALARKFISLDDLDTTQVSVLLAEGIDVMAIGQGDYDFEAYFAARRKASAGVSSGEAGREESKTSGRPDQSAAGALSETAEALLSLETRADDPEFARLGAQDSQSELARSLSAFEAQLDNPQIAQAIKSGSLSRIEEILTENGARRLAHNSDLLTFYDRKGQLVEIDNTQKHRVLYGDRNILKL